MNISGLLSTVDAVKISENRDRDAIILCSATLSNGRTIQIQFLEKGIATIRFVVFRAGGKRNEGRLSESREKWSRSVCR